MNTKKYFQTSCIPIVKGKILILVLKNTKKNHVPVHCAVIKSKTFLHLNVDISDKGERKPLESSLACLTFTVQLSPGTCSLEN